MSHRGQHSGFTLIELLVVVAIIAVLIGLLLPAVQKVREAANRAKCQNNLKQVALAIHSFHDVMGNMPQNGNPANNTQSTWSLPNGWSFIARTLPYLEQDALYRQANIDTTGINGNVSITASIPTLFCPSDTAKDESPST